LKRNKLDGLFLSSSANISYLTGFNSRDSYLLITKNKCIYITDSRYLQEAKKLSDRCCSIEKIIKSYPLTLAKLSAGLRIKRLGFEDRYLSYFWHRTIAAKLDRRTKFIPCCGPVEEIREVKTAREIRKIRFATKITKEALRFARGVISPGKTELEIAADLERFIKYRGGNGSAFRIIVAAGSNSSYPHHLTSKRKIQRNDIVLIDIGTDYQGYKSDLTRVFFLGKISPLVDGVFKVIKEAQTQAIKKVKPGIALRDIDLVARRRISEFGYGEYFIHNLGHGIGLEVHEAPHISSKEKKLAKVGMVFTLEPGIYLPGRFGVRIEDIVLVTEKGAVVL